MSATGTSKLSANPMRSGAKQDGAAIGQGGDTSIEVVNAGLLQQHGILIGGADLYRALGFDNDDAFRRARARDQIPIRIFTLPSRRGWFALTADLCQWLSLTINQKTHQPRSTEAM